MEPEPDIFYIDDSLQVPTLKWSKCSRSIASSTTVESPTSPLSASFPELPLDEGDAKTPLARPDRLISDPCINEKLNSGGSNVSCGSVDSFWNFKFNILNLDHDPIYPFTPPHKSESSFTLVNEPVTIMPATGADGKLNNGFINTENLNMYADLNRGDPIIGNCRNKPMTTDMVNIELGSMVQKKPVHPTKYVTRKNSSLSLHSRRMTVGSLCSIDKVKFTGVPTSDSILSIDKSEKEEDKVPDGGWGWVVVFSSLVISMVADGISFSFGLLYMEFLIHFGESKAKTSWIGSLFMAVPLLLGPVASSFVDKYGCRRMTMLGGIISGTGFVLSATIANSIEAQYITFGCIAGCGLSLTYVTAVVSIAYWFDKKRTFATSLGACGTGIGTFVYAPLTQYWIEVYGWRGTILMLAGTFLQMCICGALMKDPEWWILEQKRLQNQTPNHSIATKSIRNSIAESSGHDATLMYPDISEIKRVLIDGGNVESLLFNEGENEEEESNAKRIHNSVLNLPTFFMYDDIPIEVLVALSSNKALLYSTILDNIVDSPIINSTEDTTADSIPVICKQHNLSLRIRTSSSSNKNYLKKQATVDTNSPTVVSPPVENKIPTLQREFSTDESRNENNNNVKDEINNNLVNNINFVNHIPPDKNMPDGKPYFGNELVVNHVNNIKQLSLDETLLKRGDSFIVDEERTRKQYSLDDSVIRKNHLVNQDKLSTNEKLNPPSTNNHTKPNVQKNVNSGVNTGLKNKHLFNATNKKTDSLQWLKRQFSLGNKETNYFRNIKMQRNSVVYRNAMMNTKKYKLRASSCPNIFRNSMESIAESGDQKKIKDLSSEAESSQNLGPPSEKWTSEMWEMLVDMFDFSMFLELHFLLMSMATILLFTWFIVPYFYLGDYVVIRGMSDTQASSLLSCIGVLNTIGMIILGWAGDQPWMNVTKTYAGCLVLCGITIVMMPFYITNYYMLMGICAMFGLTFAANFSFTPTILVELIPLERFTTAYGLILMCQGIGNLLGPPIGGLVFDITQVWDYSFFIAGAWIIFSGVLVIIIPYTKNRVVWGGGVLEYDKESMDT
uniref:Monocarboxylate transporter 12 n=1 Tax=Cacopsylla melanoneura TaxID=428564 RepID=A0A8D8QSV8_9HEMI